MKEALSPTSSDLSSETSESNFKMDLTLNKSMIEEDIYAVFINNPDMNDKN